MNTYTINYGFEFPDGTEHKFDIRLDSATLNQISKTEAATSFPAWTALEFHQCPNCPLASESVPHCPVAINLVDLVGMCSKFNSYDDVRVEVVMQERLMSAQTTIQRGVSSLLGLTVATSPCPRTAFFKPMARFHLPLATEEETLYRATSMYLLAQYFLYKQGHNVDMSMDGLIQIYRDLQTVNTAMADRLRAADDKDSAVNAIILLDLFAKAMPQVIDDSMEELKYLFSAFLKGLDQRG